MIIKNKVAISNAEAKDILTKKGKEKEFNYEQQLAQEYLKTTTKISKTNAVKLAQELNELDLNEEQVMNIVNIMPEDEITLKLILKSIMREEKVIVLDYLPQGYAGMRKMEPIIQAIGIDHFALLELVAAKEVKLNEEIKINDKEKIVYIRRKLKESELTNLLYILEEN